MARSRNLAETGDLEGASIAAASARGYELQWQALQDELDLRKATSIVNNGALGGNYSAAEKEHPAGWREQIARLSRDERYGQFKCLLGDIAIAERVDRLIIEKRTMDLAIQSVPELRNIAEANPELAKVVNSRAGAVFSLS